MILGLTWKFKTLVYSVKDNTYYDGPPLFKYVESPASVPFNGSFILIGGFDRASFEDTGGRLLNKLIIHLTYNFPSNETGLILA